MKSIKKKTRCVSGKRIADLESAPRKYTKNNSKPKATKIFFQTQACVMQCLHFQNYERISRKYNLNIRPKNGTPGRHESNVL